MVIRNVDEVTETPVSMDGARDVSMAMMVGREDGAPNFALRSFRVAPGGHSPRHSHDYEHEVFVHGGSGAMWCSCLWIGNTSSRRGPRVSDSCAWCRSRGTVGSRPPDPDAARPCHRPRRRGAADGRGPLEATDA